MKNELQHEGVVVPMVTPLTSAGRLDEPAVDRLVDQLLAGGVNGVFVLGTTGEGAMISRSDRQRLVDRVVARVQSRALVYAGIGNQQRENATAGNEYLDAGVDAVVVRAPVSMAQAELQSYFRTLLDRLQGPMIIYNIPMLTRVSIPLAVVKQLVGHPRLVGIKDSENDADRLGALLRECGQHPGFSVFVGVGKLMEQGLRLGAHGIVPSVGNLIPETCSQLWQCARRGDWVGAKQHADRMNAVAAIYQAERDLDESLSALKGALSLRNVCQKYMSPPLQAIQEPELRTLALELDRLHLMNAPHGRAPQNTAIQPSLS
jgi:4-hydroxy-tetrahydrodipicolinate synthase